VLAIAAVVLLAAGIAAWVWGPGMYAQSGYLGVQRAAMSFGLPPDTVVFESDLEKADALIARPGADYIRAIPVPPPVADVPGPAGRRIPDALAPFGPGAGTKGVPTYVTSHALQLPDGRDVFVVVHAIGDVDKDGELALTVVAKAWLPADRTIGSRVRGAGSDAILMHIRRGTVFRLYAGTADPSDADAFRIPYDLGYEKGVMFGRVGEAGSPPKVTVKLKMGEGR
jgi:hypothetical protein